MATSTTEHGPDHTSDQWDRTWFVASVVVVAIVAAAALAPLPNLGRFALFPQDEGLLVAYPSLILHGLALSGWCALGDCLVEKSYHLSNTPSLEKSERRKLTGLDQHHRVLYIRVVPQYTFNYIGST